MAVTANPEAYELLMMEEADAWFEYADATRAVVASRYTEIEARASARRQQRLGSLALRRARLPPATEAA